MRDCLYYALVRQGRVGFSMLTGEHEGGTASFICDGNWKSSSCVGTSGFKYFSLVRVLLLFRITLNFVGGSKSLSELVSITTEFMSNKMYVHTVSLRMLSLHRLWLTWISIANDFAHHAHTKWDILPQPFLSPLFFSYFFPLLKHRFSHSHTCFYLLSINHYMIRIATMPHSANDLVYQLTYLHHTIELANSLSLFF